MLSALLGVVLAVDPHVDPFGGDPSLVLSHHGGQMLPVRVGLLLGVGRDHFQG